MKSTLRVFVLLLVALAVAEELRLAEECDEESCKLPDCRCTSTSIPGGKDARDTPQFILLNFNEAVNVVNMETYRSFYNRRNKNGCPAGVTFYVNHEYTNYVLVNELYNQGFEIGLHSITRHTPQSYWAEATYETMMSEFGDQKKQITYFANIPEEDIQGLRIPFLQMAGNSSFEMMVTVGLKYDSSWTTTSLVEPGLWPYTLNYASTQDCVMPPCPTASIPGPWVLPIIAWTDSKNFPCSFVNACIFRPDLDDEEGWFQFIMKNFERHYKGNRAPFGFYVDEWFISSNPAVRKALFRFLDLVNNLHDAFMVNANEVIEWVRDPVSVDEYARKPCLNRTLAACPANSCGPLTSEHTSISYWMQVCTPCPRLYPWLGNPLGQ